MDLMPSAEQDEITASVSAFLTKELAPQPRFAEVLPPPALDRPLLTRMAELGWFGLGLPEQLGGVGYGLVEEVLVFRELGRHSAPGPLLAMCLGARVAALAGAAGTAGAADIAARIMAARAVVGWARLPSEAAQRPTGDRSEPVEVMLFDTTGADYVLVMGTHDALLYDATAFRDRHAATCLDATVAMSRAVLLTNAAPVAIVGGHESIGARSRVLAAAFAVGMAEATRDLSAMYATQREQFGKPIGVHQGVKHRCADMAVRAEASFALACYAALVVDGLGADAAMQADAALAVALDAAQRNAADTVQVHGGMGFTWEHAAHRFVERTHVLDEMMGGSRRVLADLISRDGPNL
jgi:alkylation response protein AidB-like acyl-CoA dehydrogenase